MKYLILALFLVGCASIGIPKQDIGISEPVQPLSVELDSENVTGIVFLDTELKCVVAGGKEPYTISWSMGNCSGKDCRLQVGIGSYDVACKVKDARGTQGEASIEINVEKKQKDIDIVITLGDSLTEGFGLISPKDSNWASLFSKKYNATLHNLAVSGADTFVVIEQQLPKYRRLNISQNSIVFLWIGANDIATFTIPNDFKQNYADIVAELVSKGADLILLNIPDASKLSVADDVQSQVDSYFEQFGFSSGLSVGGITKEIIDVYNNMIYQVARDYNLDVVDIYSYMDRFSDDVISSDRFHPNEEGHKLIAEKVETEFESFYPDVTFY
ncbi:MAG: SGNH/GDSL hydrolase family protein [Nanoarchaeota archaeon]|nr:SGNH/GDSL hydrolase family protein [Nanoarchaeota archaeon]MBU1704987.1 SGNH/GDSL hydrolase family protein [Nanoarchaeota archaeon]